MGGSVAVTSEEGKGTTFTLKMKTKCLVSKMHLNENYAMDQFQRDCRRKNVNSPFGSNFDEERKSPDMAHFASSLIESESISITQPTGDEGFLFILKSATSDKLETKI
mmetsp:Transcript_17115/g.26466  ORF Transcript_17115/g.26466 Transcript_17115/m.26466 type:complete len:108 (-) Transcript_17115:1724-2047(-)